jgi:hypothetical protein
MESNMIANVKIQNICTKSLKQGETVTWWFSNYIDVSHYWSIVPSLIEGSPSGASLQIVSTGVSTSDKYPNSVFITINNNGTADVTFTIQAISLEYKKPSPLISRETKIYEIKAV